MTGEHFPSPEENNQSESHIHWQATALVEYELFLGNKPDLWDLFTYEPKDKTLFYNKLLSTFPGYVSKGYEISLSDQLEEKITNIMSRAPEADYEDSDILWAARFHGASTMAEALRVTSTYDRDRFVFMTEVQLANGKTLMEELLAKDVHSISSLDSTKREDAFFSLLNEAEDMIKSQDEHLD